jgi:putative transposase
LQRWANKHTIQLDYIQPGNPQKNAYVERYNRTVRHEWLEINEFSTIEEAQYTAAQWL